MNQNNLLSLMIITPEGSILEVNSLHSVNVPLTDNFPIGIRPGHAPLIAETIQGIIKFRKSDGIDAIEIHAGILDIRDNIVTILTSGEVSNTPVELLKPSKSEYNRLMQTLEERYDLSRDKNQELKSNAT